jgi:hypothetical protein
LLELEREREPVEKVDLGDMDEESSDEEDSVDRELVE